MSSFSGVRVAPRLCSVLASRSVSVFCYRELYMLLLISVSDRRRTFPPANGFIFLYCCSPRNGAQASQMSVQKYSVLRRRRCGEQGVLSLAPRHFWGALLHHVCLGVLGTSVMSTRSCTAVSTSCSDKLASCTVLLLPSVARLAGEHYVRSYRWMGQVS